LGAYILLFPEARVKTLIGGYGMFAEAKISARMLIGFWFVIQVFYGTIWLVKAPGQGGGVAWWAHIYGFVAGLALVHVFKRKDDGPAKPDLWPALYSNEK
jgi:membrane associated rhomboid family serine protease